MENNISKAFTRVSQVISFVWGMVYKVLVTFSIIILIGFGLDKVTGGEGNIYGYKPALILTESMTPTLQRSSVIIGKAVNGIDDIENKDIVTFKLNENGEDILVTHRVVEIDKENGLIQTKGDANETRDFFEGEDWMPINKVVYKVVHINNKISPFVNKIRNNPLNIFYIVVFLTGTSVLWRILKQDLYKEEYEIRMTNKG